MPSDTGSMMRFIDGELMHRLGRDTIRSSIKSGDPHGGDLNYHLFDCVAPAPFSVPARAFEQTADTGVP